MGESFAYNACEYFDFNQPQDTVLGDSFFEATQDNVMFETCQSEQMANYEDVQERNLSESEPMFFSPVEVSGATGFLHKLRKSVSMNLLPQQADPLELPLESAVDDLHLEQPPKKSESRSSSRAASKEHIDRLAKPKKFTSHDDLTMAEAINRFQAKTPLRFRSKPSPKIKKAAPMPRGLTRGQYPKFETENRVRPVGAISREEQERLEVEEARKFKIRANPVSRKVLKGPLKAQVEAKPPTVAVPFNLTETKKRAEAEAVEVPAFRAQPVPKALQNPFVVQTTRQPTQLKPSTVFKKSITKTDKPDARTHPTKTLVKPFSFDERDKQLIKQKEEKISRVFEEERKAREFHARPVPRNILRSRNNSIDGNSDSGSAQPITISTEEIDGGAFRARPATVLHAKPFVPKKDDNHELQVEVFHFSTDDRAQARQKFEDHLKEKEQQMISQMLEEEERKKVLEETEINKIRKQSVHKAHPVRKYREVKIEPCSKVTTPISPKFHLDRLRNKENLPE